MQNDNSKKEIKFIDLFAGIGGIRLAFEMAGCTCVFSSEINENCKIVYEKNFNEKPFGDITSVDFSTIPNHQILTAGFPCQPFSISGKQKGFEDTRGTLFFYVMRIVKEKQPEVVFLENVKHLVHHDKGRTLLTILKSLEDEGYFVNYRVLNARDFGLAQNRERIIIVASKKGYFDFNKVKNFSKPVLIKDILEEGSDAFEYLNENEYTILDKSKWKLQQSGLIFCGYRNKKIRSNGVRKNTIHLSRVHKQPNRIYSIDGTHPTIPSQESSGRFWIYDGLKVRKLTINECYRLMGFPDNFIKSFVKTEQYKQIGNSVPVNLIKSVADEIVNQLINDNLTEHIQHRVKNVIVQKVLFNL